MTWRRQFWTGDLVSGDRKISPESHGAEGTIHYYRGDEYYRMGYSNGATQGVAWAIDTRTIAEVDSDGQKLTISPDIRDLLMSELSEATMDVWRQTTIPMAPFNANDV